MMMFPTISNLDCLDNSQKVKKVRFKGLRSTLNDSEVTQDFRKVREY
jgi:hypothetical protein